MSAIVAIVGRPNVGKSTLFNRLVQSREAIVDATSGVTRDRHYGKADWNGKAFSVVDTGGYVVGSDDVFESEIDKQVDLAIDEADIILFLIDASAGITPLDQDIHVMLRKVKKPIFVVANKSDACKSLSDMAELYVLGIDTYYPISGISGSGTGDLLDEVVKKLPENNEGEELQLPRFAVVGRPNAGKSSFINMISGEDRHIVTDIAGTTRDSSYSKYTKFGFEFYLVDTAGIRKKSKVKDDLEFYSVMRSVRAIENADVCLLLVDATRGFESQDNAIFWLAERNRKGVVILVNKWDLVEKDTNSTKKFIQSIEEQIAPFTDVPILFVSVLEKQRLVKALEMALRVYKNKTTRIPTRKLNDVMLPIIEGTPPPSIKGKYVKIKYCTQLPTPTPQFAFFANLPKYVKDPYRRYVENQMRQHFDFHGVPIEVYFREK